MPRRLHWKIALVFAVPEVTEDRGKSVCEALEVGQSRHWDAHVVDDPL